MAGQHDSDSVHRFLMESHKITIEAQFIIDSLPNAETPAVERIVHQLGAIQTLLSNLNDPWTSEARRTTLIDHTNSLLLPLEHFLNNPPPPPSDRTRRSYTGLAGRPTYVLDLNRAVLLHNLGNTWKDISKALGVSRSTLYNHMDAAGISTARKEFTAIEDAELDAIVAEIAQEHPFVGSTIILGHLETRGIHLPPKRVQESLRRVDSVGVLLR